MKRPAMVVLFVLLSFTFSFANRVIAKDSTPGGIYIVGPDVSPDSTGYSSDLLFLYYSPDSGKTLEIRDTIGRYEHIYSIAADDSFDVLYADWDLFLRVSWDGGRNWTETGYPCYSEVFSGVYPGELMVSVVDWSTDFGTTFRRVDFPGEISWRAEANATIGWERGESFVLIYTDAAHINEPGDIFKLTNYGDSCWKVSSLGHVGEIFNGGAPPEMYLYAYDTIYLSLDSYESLELMGITPVVFNEVIGGKSPCELYGYRYGYYIEPMEGRCGWIEIWHSSDCGRSWCVIARHDSCGSMIRDETEKEDFNYEIKGGYVKSSEYLYLLDLSGRVCGEGKDIGLIDKESGIYFLSNGRMMKKILWLK